MSNNIKKENNLLSQLTIEHNSGSCFGQAEEGGGA
jgi:hypothetical protein